ncbi:MAG: hypothetical protein KC560_18800 [Myxococcales bacterium]|nr:hypothetical protein [Myxococcales bacterium]
MSRSRPVPFRAARRPHPRLPAVAARALAATSTAAFPVASTAAFATFVAVAFAAFAAAAPAPARAQVDEAAVDEAAVDEAAAGIAPARRGLPPEVVGFFVLGFNRWGELQAPGEREQLIAHLRENPQIERLILISYGWANDGESSYGTYIELLRDLLASAPERGPQIPTTVIAIGWDSSQTGFRKLANDLIPFPVLADWLAYLPDHLLFPISFWSKAAMADRIGYGGLRTELNTIFANAYPENGAIARPEIVLIGHSFGTRIVSGLMQNHLALARVRSEPFASADRVRGAVLIQPALVLPNLHRDADYPVIVTQSRHDHANGFLFPTANLVVNAYSFTSFEAIFRQRVFGVMTEQAERGTKRAAEAVQLVMPGFGRGEQNEREDVEPRMLDGLAIPLPPLADRPFDLFQRGLAEVVSVPIALLYSAITTPVNYATTQARGLARGPHHHVMDTLAQLPVLEVLTDVSSDALGISPRWGERHKGFFDLGLLNESAGRLTVAPYEPPRDFPTIALDELHDTPRGANGCGLPACRGLVFVDVSPVVDHGVFGLSLERRWVDYTLGWLDPIGAHADYRKPEIVELMGRITSRADGDAPDAR